MADAEAEVEKSAGNCDFYADNGPKMLEPARLIDDHARESYVAFEPLGVILAVMPWNFPVWQLIRHAAPALVAGNTIVLKHASNVTGMRTGHARAGRSRSRSAGRSNHRRWSSPADRVEDVIDDPRIAAVTLTGSDAGWQQDRRGRRSQYQEERPRAGRIGCVHRAAGCRSGWRADYASRSRFQNAGQVCISAKRFIVVD